MSKIVDKPETYFSRFARDDDPLLQELEREAAAEHIPIVGPVLGELLFVLAGATGAGSILELGTAGGYSAIFLARAAALNDGMLTTVEIDPVLAARARTNLERAGLADRVSVVCNDVLTHLSRCTGSHDLIFVDIEKADYVHVLPDCRRLLRPGGC